MSRYEQIVEDVFPAEEIQARATNLVLDFILDEELDASPLYKEPVQPLRPIPSRGEFSSGTGNETPVLEKCAFNIDAP